MFDSSIKKIIEQYEKSGQKRHRNFVNDATDGFIVNFEQILLSIQLSLFLIRNIISPAVKLTVTIIRYRI